MFSDGESGLTDLVSLGLNAQKARSDIPMAIEARIRELGSRHQNIDRAIQDEMKHPAHDDMRLRELKRQKLKLKEQIEGLRSKAH